MRKYIWRERQIKEEILVETTCDLCDKVAKEGHWESSSYEVNETEIEVTVRQKDGHSFPEGGSGEEYVVDMCPGCFKEKLIPWLESQGCKAKIKEWLW